ncbi:hypothetical protein FQA39_LY05523 [Lamprigera yunnana]|nr:hypothetical protein FQA39_LY05523 [Lamprigera yunnana]
MVLLGTFVQPEPPILFEKEETKAILDGVDLGDGTVYISERLLGWKDQSGNGFCIGYPHISLHAITTDPTVYPSKCLYVMIDGHLTLQHTEMVNLTQVNGNNDDSDSDDEQQEEVETSRLVLVPSDLNSINHLFTALSHGQSLNPDPADCIDEIEEEDDDDDEDMYFGDAEEYLTLFRIDRSADTTDNDMNYLSMQLQNNSIHVNGDDDFDDIDDNEFEDAD